MKTTQQLIDSTSCNVMAEVLDSYHESNIGDVWNEFPDDVRRDICCSVLEEIDQLAKQIAMDCILQLQMKIMRDGNTPENKRTHMHINDIATRYNIDMLDEMREFAKAML